MVYGLHYTIEYFNNAAQKADLWVSGEEAEKKAGVVYQTLQRRVLNNLAREQ
ncbi:MAG TPA: hypothetical protein PLH24_08335 [Candidatus Atribacteria bacterium]|nr:hypothetical protein [Candidatus Atribacteria bacterium]